MLENKVVLVTGASRGIGRAVAKALAANRATVILLSRTIPDLEKLYDEIVHAGYPQPSIYPFNLCNASPEDFDDLRRNIAAAYGRLDGLIHNAGVLGSLTPVEHYSLQTWYSVLQTNLNSRLLLTQATMPLLKQAPSGSILFTTSALNQAPKAFWGAYAVASAGSETLMRMLAAECENICNVRINAVQPDKVKTALRAAAYPAEPDAELIDPESITDLYVYLMSDLSRDRNGETFYTNNRLVFS